jgi:hypothetical protein
MHWRPADCARICRACQYQAWGCRRRPDCGCPLRNGREKRDLKYCCFLRILIRKPERKGRWLWLLGCDRHSGRGGSTGERFRCRLSALATNGTAGWKFERCSVVTVACEVPTGRNQVGWCSPEGELTRELRIQNPGRKQRGSLVVDMERDAKSLSKLTKLVRFEKGSEVTRQF